MLHPTFIIDETPTQVDYNPQQNADRTQHQPVGGAMTSALLLLAAIIIIYQAVK